MQLCTITCKQFGTRSGSTKRCFVGPDLDPNCLLLNFFSEKFDYEACNIILSIGKLLCWSFHIVNIENMLKMASDD